MTVKASAKDTDGALLDSRVATLQTAANAASGKAHSAALLAALDQAQRELVHHYLDVGRITAANILSTLS